MRYAEIILDEVHNEDRTWTYSIPENLQVHEGSRVFVPFGFRKKIVEGFVIKIKDSCDYDPSKIKSVEKSPDKFIALKPEVLAIAPLICDKFKLRLIDVLRLFVPATVRSRKRERIAANKELRALDIKNKDIVLTKEQQSAVSEILGSKKTFVLHGVTGSGKTEVYMRVIAEVLKQGKSAIMLVPEIGLTPQMLGNFRMRFGDSVAMIHSGLSQTERYDQWISLHKGEKKIVIGARSAVFAPLENIGVVIIDEEHDTSYFAESNPRFHTHDIARMRCDFNEAPLVLGSATPSVETIHSGYKVLELKNRVNNLCMPNIKIVDMIAEIRGGHGGVISRDLLAALKDAINAKKSAMIFLNRRGFSSYVGCLDCGWIAKCESCDVSLVWHKLDGQLKCHYCSARYSRATKCQECSSGLLRYGQIGTQKLVEEIQSILPTITVFRLDTDNAKESLNILQEFGSTPGSILVGTQMIAKGHDFPSVAVVGIVDADNALHFSDYRAGERTFALITQVAGRAGRAGDGQVFLQTYKPRHYVYNLVAQYKYKEFLEKELNAREVTQFPPFTTIIRVLITGEDEATICKYLQPLMKKLRVREKDMVFLGAMKSPLGKLQNKYRYQILLRFTRKKEKDLIDWVHQVVKSEPAKNLHVFLEINPQSLS
ncbi:MAG: primosomal protein N' [Firmicutes bacterium]|nr:primosomal protein N' [Bacillota bacterium]